VGADKVIIMRIKIILAAAVAVVLLAWLGFRAARQPAAAVTKSTPVAWRPTARFQGGALHAPHAIVHGPEANLAPAKELFPTNLFTHLIYGPGPELTLAQFAHYLDVNGRNAESLLAASYVTGDRSLLGEAIAKYPNDPRVAFTAWYRSPPEYNNPEGLKVRRQALDQLKVAAPDNALANYLSAANYFKSGQPELAFQEMEAGAAKPRYDDYTLEAMQGLTEAYQAVGYSDAESKAAGTLTVGLNHLSEIKHAGLSLLDMANTYQQAGDGAAAQALRQMCLDLGQRLDDPNATTVIQTLTGIAMQSKALEALMANAPDAAAAQAAQAQLDAVIRMREGIKAMTAAQCFNTWLQTAPAQEISNYFDRQRLFGERRAMEWLARQHAK
jgi:hypothetical protein